MPVTGRGTKNIHHEPGWYVVKPHVSGHTLGRLGVDGMWHILVSPVGRGARLERANGVAWMFDRIDDLGGDLDGEYRMEVPAPPTPTPTNSAGSDDPSQWTPAQLEEIRAQAAGGTPAPAPPPLAPAVTTLDDAVRGMHDAAESLAQAYRTLARAARRTVEQSVHVRVEVGAPDELGNGAIAFDIPPDLGALSNGLPAAMMEVAVIVQSSGHWQRIRRVTHGPSLTQNQAEQFQRAGDMIKKYAAGDYARAPLTGGGR